MAVAEKETLGFQAEVKQLLQLMIHSLYSNKEIFLRELISNASDAADKLRFEAINNDALYGNDHELKITVSFDKDAKTITISDNGIGMSRDEVISHLGTIAKSGTKEFFGKLSGDQQADAALIGQFGVGFYSGFIVADKIIVNTRRAGEFASEGVRWESRGEGDYSVEPIEKTNRGTDVILHLRAGEEELLSSWKLKSIIRKYSDHISLPIHDAEGRVGRREERNRPEGRIRDRQPGQRAVGPQQGRHHAGAVRRILQARLARLPGAADADPQPRRGPQRVHPAAVRAEPRAVRPVGPQQARRHQAVRQARVHHGRRRAADAGLPALHQGRDRLERPAAERLARDPAGVARRQGDPRRLDQARAGHAGRTGQRRRAGKEGQVHHLLEGVRPGAEGRHRRGRDQQGPHRQAAALRLDRERQRRPEHLAGRLHRPHEGRPGRRSTTSPATTTPRPRTARTSRSSARRASKCC